MVATGVELVDGRKFIARKEVIVTYRAIRTPQVLMLSGIGPAKQLGIIEIRQLLKSPKVEHSF